MTPVFSLGTSDRGQHVRVGVAQVSIESNDFVPFVCERIDFENTGFILRGSEIERGLDGSSVELAGAIAELRRQGAEPIGLFAARGTSSGRLSASWWNEILVELETAFASAGELHAVVLSNHGSMLAIGDDDPEATLAELVRRLVGPDVPIVMTLDLHGNVSKRMVASLTAIIGYEHYPHDDTYTTGERAARLALAAANGTVNLCMVHGKLPMIATAFNGSTYGDGPFARVMNRTKAKEQAKGTLSTSAFMVGSYIDVPDMGCSIVVITDNDEVAAKEAVVELCDYFWSIRNQLLVEGISVAEAVERGRAIEGQPVLLLDTGDGSGGGAAGDNAQVLQELLNLEVREPALVSVVDPRAAEECHRAGVGAIISLRVGHAIDPQWGEPVPVTGEVMRLSDGRFRYEGGLLGGREVTMGPSAVVRSGNIDLLIASRATYEWADEQYRSMGLNAADAKFVQAKNMMNFRVAFGDVMKAYYVLDLPGPTGIDFRQFPMTRVNRPIFPLDLDLETAHPEISHGHRRPTGLADSGDDPLDVGEHGLLQ